MEYEVYTTRTKDGSFNKDIIGADSVAHLNDILKRWYPNFLSAYTYDEKGNDIWLKS